MAYVRRGEAPRTEHLEQKSAENRARRTVTQEGKNTSKRPNQRTEQPRTRHMKNTTSREEEKEEPLGSTAKTRYLQLTSQLQAGTRVARDAKQERKTRYWEEAR